MTDPRKWTAKELARDAAMAAERFRRERPEEPLEHHTRLDTLPGAFFGDRLARHPSEIRCGRISEWSMGGPQAMPP